LYGWEKGQVENQVGLVRERFFTPRFWSKTYDELNTWLLDKCIAYAGAHRHPELTEQTVWEVFEAERPKLVPYAGRFDGFHAAPAERTPLWGTQTSAILTKIRMARSPATILSVSRASSSCGSTGTATAASLRMK